MHCLSLKYYFLYLNIVWTFIYLTVLRKYPELFTDTVFLYLMVLKIFPRLWGTGISDAIFLFFTATVQRSVDCNDSEVESAVEAYLKYAQEHVGGVGRKLIICSTRGLKYSDTKEHLQIKCG